MNAYDSTQLCPQRRRSVRGQESLGHGNQKWPDKSGPPKMCVHFYSGKFGPKKWKKNIDGSRSPIDITNSLYFTSCYQLKNTDILSVNTNTTEIIISSAILMSLFSTQCCVSR